MNWLDLTQALRLIVGSAAIAAIGCGEQQDGRGTPSPGAAGAGSNFSVGTAGASSGFIASNDCSKLANSENPECVYPSCDKLSLSIGSGPRLCSWPEVGSGFLDIGENRLVAPVTINANTDSSYGIILGVDLATGNRTLLSGVYEDPATGPVSRGLPASPLEETPLVRQTPDGFWVAVAGESLLRINPANGDRTVILEGDEISCVGLEAQAALVLSSMAVGGDGALYFLLNNVNSGVVKLSGSSLTCTLVSRVSTVESERKGAGVSALPNVGGRMQFKDGKLWIVGDHSVFSVDAATGERRRVSSASLGVGSGDAEIQGGVIAIGSGAIWTFANWDKNTFTAVDISTDPPTGNRKSFLPKSGPAARSGTIEMEGIWMLPDPSVFITSTDGAFLMVNLNSGNSFTFSR